MQMITRVLCSIAYVVFIQGPHIPFLSQILLFFLSYLGNKCMLNVAIPKWWHMCALLLK